MNQVLRGWIFGLTSLFGVGVLYILFEMVFFAKLFPVFRGIVNNDMGSAILIDNSTQIVINAAYDQYLIFFRLIPFILFLVIVIYLFVISFRREEESEYNSYGGQQ